MHLCVGLGKQSAAKSVCNTPTTASRLHDESDVTVIILIIQHRRRLLLLLVLQVMLRLRRVIDSAAHGGCVVKLIQWGRVRVEAIAVYTILNQ